MKNQFYRVVGLAMAITLVGLFLACAGEVYQMPMDVPPEEPGQEPPPPKTITFPNGTVFGGASTDQASTLAQIMVDANNNNMQEFQRLHAKNDQILDETTKNLQTSKQALALLENLMRQQGTGDITLFFGSGKSQITNGSENYGRLVRFLDYIAVKSQGRKALFLLIGSASSTGKHEFNVKLSQKRAEAPVPIIEKYLLNIPHDFYKVYGLGDLYSPVGGESVKDERYQNVRVIAFYDTDQVPLVPEDPFSD
jgi:outer membrane protein OmpA-like peptidoglycan-associated protein